MGTTMSDNLEIIATGEGLVRLSAVLALCTNWENDKAAFSGWAFLDGGIFFKDREGTPFPAPIDCDQAAKMALDVLRDSKQWPREPDIDGHCAKGWRVEQDWEGTKVLPFWIIYHK